LAGRRAQATIQFDHVVDYDIDNEDSAWLAELNAKAEAQVR
jgi:hypothetical protein